MLFDMRSAFMSVCDECSARLMEVERQWLEERGMPMPVVEGAEQKTCKGGEEVSVRDGGKGVDEERAKGRGRASDAGAAELS